MSLLLRPARGRLEGPSGHRLRVAQANLLPASLQDFADDAKPACERAADEANGPAWIRRRARWCPQCLGTTGHWRLGWELLFADACPQCGHWLLDRCCQCGEALSWQRDGLLRCQCGTNLCSEVSSPAPDALVFLSRTLEAAASGSCSGPIVCMAKLNAPQCVRLVRLLGSYGTRSGMTKPQKILGLDTLEVSWAISTYAAEVLGDWPAGFDRLLTQLSAASEATKSGRMGHAFGGLYRALYGAFREPAFDWVREAFENHVAQHWTGAIGRRNRRLQESVLRRVEWLPAPAASKLLGVSTRRLQDLVTNGQVLASERTSANGRRFAVVSRSSVEAQLQAMSSEMTLVSAAAVLGIKRQRLSRLLRQICPEAVKLTASGTPWGIPVSWVNAWQAQLGALDPMPDALTGGHVTLDHVLRYWPISEHELGRLLVDVERGVLKAKGAAATLTGLPSLVFGGEQLEPYLDRGANLGETLLSIPDVAERLGVKQEVAYSLVRSKLLPVRVHSKRPAVPS